MNEFNPYNDELYHWAKGDTKTGAKYIARKWVNGKWQYVYSRLDQAKKKAPGELAKAEKKTKKIGQDIYAKGKTTTPKVKKGAKDAYSFVKSNSNKTVKSTKNYASNVYNNAKAYGTRKVKEYRRAKAETPSVGGKSQMNNKGTIDWDDNDPKGIKKLSSGTNPNLLEWYNGKSDNTITGIYRGYRRSDDTYADRLNRELKKRNEEIERKKKYQSRASTNGKYYK